MVEVNATMTKTFHRKKEDLDKDWDERSQESARPNSPYGRYQSRKMKQQRRKKPSNFFFDRDKNAKRERSHQQGTASPRNAFEMFSNYVLNSNSDPFSTKSKISSIFPTRQPRHILEGVASGLRSVLVGVGMATLTFVMIPMAGFIHKSEESDHNHNKWIGLFVGGIYGALYGLTFLLVGFLNGVCQAVRGLVLTPTAVNASRHGMVWDQDKEIWKFYYLEDEMEEITSFQPFLNTERPVKDLTYYNMLNVPSTADVKEIKRAYYREARFVHPDKNPGNETAAELFRKLHSAYLTLSDTEKRLAYDHWGFSQKYIDSGGDGALGIPQFDINVFYTIMFNSQPVEQYIGNFTLSSFTNKVLNFARSGGGDSPEDVLKLIWSTNSSLQSRRKRELNIAMFLNERVTSFVNGMVTRSEFRKNCQQEALSIARGQFGLKYLNAIGAALILESNQSLNSRGSILLPFRNVAGWLRKKLNIIEVYVPVFREMVDTIQLMKLKEVTPNETELLELLAPLVIDFAWAYNVVDIQNTLSGACKRLFADSAVNSRYTRLERAEAIRILGEEFLFIAKRESERLAMEKITNIPDDLVARMEAAAEIAVMKASGFDFTEDTETMIRNHKRKL